MIILYVHYNLCFIFGLGTVENNQIMYYDDLLLRLRQYGLCLIPLVLNPDNIYLYIQNFILVMISLKSMKTNLSFKSLILQRFYRNCRLNVHI